MKDVLQIAVCDDDLHALPVITGAIRATFDARNIRTEITSFQSGKEMTKALAGENYDLLFLDIDMPGMDGIEVGQWIRESGSHQQIIYVSECESRVFEAFQVQPFGFVRKSNFVNDISSIVSIYIQAVQREEKEELLVFSTREGQIRFSSSDVIYLEGSRNYQLLYIKGRKEPVEVDMTMEKLENMLESKGFLRIHKGFLVNYRYIRRIHSLGVELKTGDSLPVGRTRLQEVKQKYLKLISG